MTSNSTTTACPRCGAQTPTGQRFCGSCGSPVTLDVSNPASSAETSGGPGASNRDRLSDSGAIQLRQLLVEATRGEFDILEELGRGGMAIVYKSLDVHLSRPVAIKVLPPDLTYARGTTERFQREAKTAAVLDHPNIIPIYRISSGGKLFWYAMKYLEGRSLAEILSEKGLLTTSETIAILEQVGEALDYAHQRGVVHRDVKPGNVMLDVNGRVTVTDFGIAKELSGSGLTGSGAILGTPYYMSPEQCRGSSTLTGAADQYSLAVMTYQMICGQLPFEADSAIDVIHKHVAESPPSLERLLPGLPKHIINAINRGMSKKAEDRFPTVQAFVNALKNAPADATLMMERSPSPSRSTRRPSGAVTRSPSLPRTAARIAAGVVLVGSVVAGALWLNDRSQSLASEVDPAVPPAAASDRQTGTAAGTPADGIDRNAAPNAAPPAAAPRRPAPAPAPPAAPAVDPNRKGFVRIAITNSYATFSIADRTVTERRGFADSIAPGTYQVVFTRDGFESVTRSITVRPGQEATVSVQMRPRGTP